MISQRTKKVENDGVPEKKIYTVNPSKLVFSIPSGQVEPRVDIIITARDTFTARYIVNTTSVAHALFAILLEA